MSSQLARRPTSNPQGQAPIAGTDSNETREMVTHKLENVLSDTAANTEPAKEWKYGTLVIERYFESKFWELEAVVLPLRAMAKENAIVNQLLKFFRNPSMNQEDMEDRIGSLYRLVARNKSRGATQPYDVANLRLSRAIKSSFVKAEAVIKERIQSIIVDAVERIDEEMKDPSLRRSLENKYELQWALRNWVNFSKNPEIMLSSKANLDNAIIEVYLKFQEAQKKLLEWSQAYEAKLNPKSKIVERTIQSIRNKLR